MKHFTALEALGHSLGHSLRHLSYGTHCLSTTCIHKRDSAIPLPTWACNDWVEFEQAKHLLTLFTLMNMQKDLSGVANVLKMNPSSLPKTVIFCSKKETASSVYRFLHCSDKSSVTMYHASTDKEGCIQWIVSHIRCLVSTLAFGMVCMVAHTMLVYPAISVEVSSIFQHLLLPVLVWGSWYGQTRSYPGSLDTGLNNM